MQKQRHFFDLAFSAICLATFLVGCDSKTSEKQPLKQEQPKPAPTPSPAPEASPTPYVDRVLAKVGRFEIWISDVNAYADIQKIYPYGQRGNSQLESLIGLFKWASAYEKLGHELNDQVLADYIPVLSKSKFAADRIDRIKEIVKNDNNRFNKLFVMPLFVLKKLPGEEYQKAVRSGATSLISAHEIVQQSQNKPKELEKIAGERGLVADTLEADEKKGVLKKGSKDIVASFPSILKTAKSGSILADPVMIADLATVIRLDNVSKTKIFTLTAVAVPNQLFSEWVAGLTKDIPIERMK